MSSNRQRCIFCGSDTNRRSREHIFRSKLRDYCPDLGAVVYEDFKEGEKRELRTTLFDQVLRKVCKQCNEGWMNDLEVEAEPALSSLMLGKSDLVSGEEARVISRWAAKTNIVRGHASRSSTIPAADAQLVRSDRQLSEHWTVAAWHISEANATDRLRFFEHDIYTITADDPSSKRTHHGRVRAQEHVLIMGNAVIYSRFGRDPVEFLGGLERCWKRAFADVGMSPAYLTLDTPPESGAHPIPKLDASEQWRLGELFPTAYRYAAGKVWRETSVG